MEKSSSLSDLSSDDNKKECKDFSSSPNKLIIGNIMDNIG